MNTPPTPVAFVCMLQFGRYPLTDTVPFMHWVVRQGLTVFERPRPSAVTLRGR